MEESKELPQYSLPQKTPDYITKQDATALINSVLSSYSGQIKLSSGSIATASGNLNVTNSSTSVKVDALGTGSIINIQDWTSTMTFSASNYQTVAWTAGTITLADGTAFSILAGNTGAMTVATYIYFDKAASTTVLQTTTTAATSVGANKILICAAYNVADTGKNASFQAFGGNGGVKVPVGTADLVAGAVTANEIAANTITAAKIAANTITASQIAANTITASQMSVATLSAITADLGTITAGSITGVTINSSSGNNKIVLNTGNSIDIYNGTTLVGQIFGSDGAYTTISTAYQVFIKIGASNRYRFDSGWLRPVTDGSVSLGTANADGTSPYRFTAVRLGDSSNVGQVLGGGADRTVSGRVDIGSQNGQIAFRMWTGNSPVGQYNTNYGTGGWGSAAFDYAEKIPLESDDIESGDVVTISDTNNKMMKKCDMEYDPCARVISTKPGFVGGIPWEKDEKEEEAEKLSEESDIHLTQAIGIINEEDNRRREDKRRKQFKTASCPDLSKATAICGIVPVKVSVSNGIIKHRDPIASSSVSGVAMLATEKGKPILGYAMEGTDKDEKIEVFLSYNSPLI